MKHSYLLFFFIISILSACEPKTKVEAITEQKKQYAFTDTTKLDTFKISLIGKESKEMNLVFTVTNFNGKEIYKQEIKADQLLKSYLASEDLKKEDDKIKFLNEQMHIFFDEEHFLEPAVTEEQQPDNNAPDKAFYDELKLTKLNGFYYSLGKDKSIYIAWSAKEQKVKIYYKCC